MPVGDQVVLGAGPPPVDRRRTCVLPPFTGATDLEHVMSTWWLASEAGAGEAAGKDVGAVLELAQAPSDGRVSAYSPMCRAAYG